MTAFIDAGSLTFLGRLLVGGLFIIGGAYHFFVLPPMLRQMRERGIPFPPFTLVTGSLFQIFAGLAIMLDFYVPLAAAGLIGFTVASSCMVMNFWGMEGEERMHAIDGWVSNLGVIGGLLLVAALA